MNSHKHARLTYARRLELVEDLIKGGVGTTQAALDYGVTPRTVRKWLGRFLAGGEVALADASSRPMRSPKKIDEAKAMRIAELRRRRMTQARIAISVGVSESTVSRVLKRAGISKLKDLEPAEAVVRYEHEAPGDLLHIDTKKLGRIVRPGPRVTGKRKDAVRGAGWEMLFIAIDDHSRLAFTALHPDAGPGSGLAAANSILTAHHGRMPAPTGHRERLCADFSRIEFNADERSLKQAGLACTKPMNDALQHVDLRVDCSRTLGCQAPL